MRSQIHPEANARRGRRGLGIAGLLVAALALAGCSPEEVRRGFFPAESVGATNHTQEITDLWNGAWIVLLIVGLITWILIIWCIVAYRRRRNETGMPVQLRYNMPIEAFYIVVPLIMVLVFYGLTEQLQSKIDAPNNASRQIEVVGKQWSWDFNYLSDDVYFAGTQAQLNGTDEPGLEAPTLYFEVNEPVEIKLRSRDVLHSFWIPAFLQKRDMVPGRESSIYFTPQREGTFVGKCAELCGEYHSEMLFNVKVVSTAEYDAYVASLRTEGNTGRLGPEFDRDPGLVERQKAEQGTAESTTEGGH